MSAFMLQDVSLRCSVSSIELFEHQQEPESWITYGLPCVMKIQKQDNHDDTAAGFASFAIKRIKYTGSGAGLSQIEDTKSNLI